jgi:hypothetical protein
MTARRAVFLECDAVDPTQPFGCEAMPDDSRVPNVSTAVAARAQAKKRGWERTRDGRDLCPYHRTESPANGV